MTVLVAYGSDVSVGGDKSAVAVLPLDNACDVTNVSEPITVCVEAMCRWAATSLQSLCHG